MDGVSGAAPVVQFDASAYQTRFACELKGFDASDFIDKRLIRQSDPYVQYSLACVVEAMRQSGIDLEKVNRQRCGVIWTSGIGGLQSLEEEIGKFTLREGPPKINPFYIPKIITNMASGTIAMQYGFSGINFATTSACASSTHALIDAFNYIRLGKADIIISGGAEAGITPTGFAGFNSLHALSTRNESPETASRPFDAERDGFVMGEGAGALILEELEHARARGAEIYAEIAGGGFSCDAYHMTAPHPEGAGAVLSMRTAIDDAGLTTADVDYLNCHATATPAGDIGESMAVKTLFDGHLDSLYISGTKSMTGHMLGAAGAVEALICIAALMEQKIPPTINTRTIDPLIPEDLRIVTGKAIPARVDTAMSNTFGFGGHNATIIVKRYEED